MEAVYGHTRVRFRDGGSSPKVARNVRVAVLLVVAVESVRGVGQEGVRLEAGASFLDGSAVGHPETAGPVQRSLHIHLGHSCKCYAPGCSPNEGRVAFRRRHRCHRKRCLRLLFSSATIRFHSCGFRHESDRLITLSFEWTNRDMQRKQVESTESCLKMFLWLSYVP